MAVDLESFYDPDFGLLNRFLNATGMMQVLVWLDGSATAPGVMPKIASGLQPVFAGVVNPLFGSIWGLMIFGCLVLSLIARGERSLHNRNEQAVMLALPLIWTLGLLLGIAATVPGFFFLFALSCYLLYLLAKTAGGFWVLWFLWLAPLVALFWHNPLYITLLPLAAMAVNHLCYRRGGPFTGQSWGEWHRLGLAHFRVISGRIRNDLDRTHRAIFTRVLLHG
ncbi:MAG: hypothetical protein LR015_05510 [Verrucomicrobia bacterium]|nr:hypothetical protein [Verrucomicrobiota bacterium]